MDQYCRQIVPVIHSLAVKSLTIPKEQKCNSGSSAHNEDDHVWPDLYTTQTVKCFHMFFMNTILAAVGHFQFSLN